MIADPGVSIVDAPISVSLPSHQDLADDFRNRAYQLMIGEPIAATHLVLAAATLAPTCPAEREVADHFTYLVADPLPLLKLLTAQSNCFQVVDRGEGFDALQRERQLAAGGSVAGANNQATLRAADYMLTARVLYTDNNAGGAGGGLGSMFPGGIGFKQKKLEASVMLSMIEVKSGLQLAVSTGSARKKDLSIVAGGILTNAGVGALGGAYTNTDIGKITSLALLDAFRKITTDARGRIAVSAPAAPPTAASQLPTAPVAVAAPKR